MLFYLTVLINLLFLIIYRYYYFSHYSDIVFCLQNCSHASLFIFRLLQQSKLPEQETVPLSSHVVKIFSLIITEVTLRLVHLCIICLNSNMNQTQSQQSLSNSASDSHTGNTNSYVSLQTLILLISIVALHS